MAFIPSSYVKASGQVEQPKMTPWENVLPQYKFPHYFGGVLGPIISDFRDYYIDNIRFSTL